MGVGGDCAALSDSMVLTCVPELRPAHASVCWLRAWEAGACRSERPFLLRQLTSAPDFPICAQVGQEVRAKRKENEIPLNPFTAGVYVATMMATVEVRNPPYCTRSSNAVLFEWHGILPGVLRPVPDALLAALTARQLPFSSKMIDV